MELQITTADIQVTSASLDISAVKSPMAFSIEKISVFINGSDEDDLPPALAAAAAASTPVSSASPGSQKTCTPQTSEGQTQVSPSGKVTHKEMSFCPLGEGSGRVGGSCE